MSGGQTALRSLSASVSVHKSVSVFVSVPVSAVFDSAVFVYMSVTCPNPQSSYVSVSLSVSMYVSVVWLA